MYDIKGLRHLIWKPQSMALKGFPFQEQVASCFIDFSDGLKARTKEQLQAIRGLWTLADATVVRD